MRSVLPNSWLAMGICLVCSTGLYGCATWCPGKTDLRPRYNDDTIEHLIDSFLIAWNRHEDAIVYDLSTARAEQTTESRNAFIADGAEKCRWYAAYWGMEAPVLAAGQERVSVPVTMVTMEEGSTSPGTLRFECALDGGRWRIVTWIWDEDGVELRDDAPWMHANVES